MLRKNSLAPWLDALHNGAIGLALLLIAMQASLVFWPAAVRRGRKFERDLRLQFYLNDLSANYAGWRQSPPFPPTGSLRTMQVVG